VSCQLSEADGLKQLQAQASTHDTEVVYLFDHGTNTWFNLSDNQGRTQEVLKDQLQQFVNNLNDVYLKLVSQSKNNHVKKLFIKTGFKTIN